MNCWRLSLSSGAWQAAWSRRIARRLDPQSDDLAEVARGIIAWLDDPPQDTLARDPGCFSAAKLGLARSPGVVYCGSRSYNRLVGGRISKIYRRNQVARESFERDLEYARRFQAFSWSVPVLDTGITWLGQRWIEMETLPQERRMDRYIAQVGEDRALVFAMQILSAILDLHCMRVAHRDVHARNVFCLDDGIRLIDFDVAVDYPEGYRPRFSDCYDLTGMGLESPHAASHACMFASHFPFAIGRLMKFEHEALLHQLRRDCEYDARALMARGLDGSVSYWFRDHHGDVVEGSAEVPAAVPGVEVHVSGFQCAGMVDTLMKSGYASIHVYERNAHCLHVLRRWVESNEVKGIALAEWDESRSVGYIASQN